MNSAPIFHIKRDRQSAVAAISDDLGLTYKIIAPDGEPSLVKFRFDAMPKEKLLAWSIKFPLKRSRIKPWLEVRRPTFKRYAKRPASQVAIDPRRETAQFPK